MVVVAIIAVLSGMILYTVSQYINKGKDSNIFGNMAILIPAGETFYNGNSGSYDGFCDPTPSGNSVIRNVISQMPININGDCYNSSADSTTWDTKAQGLNNGNPAGICCFAQSQSWVACARELTDDSEAYCVDSRGVKEDIPNAACTNNLTQCSI